MTVQPSAVPNDPSGRQLSSGEGGLSPLDAFLRSGPQEWGAAAAPCRRGGLAALRFDATPGSVTRTRRFLRSTLTGWQLEDLVDDATTVAAELVANAVTHALGPSALAPAAYPA